MRYVYDPETLEIIDTEARLDLLRVYARVPYHENGAHITQLLNGASPKLAQPPETDSPSVAK